jgi:flagellar motor switch protein FliN/FliY
VATSDQQAIARFAERMGTAMSAAISEAFGGAASIASQTSGVLPLLVMEMGDGHHLHLEIEAAAGRLARNMVIVLRPEDAERLFDLEPTDPAMLAQPETQLSVLGEFTEGAEALAGALAGTLAAVGPLVTFRVSGASLEEADASPTAAVAPLGTAEAVAFSVVLNRPPGAPITMVVGAPPELAAAIGAAYGAGDGDAGPSAAERAASLAARVAARRAPVENVPLPQPPPTPAAPAVIAHPFSFGQIDPPAAAPARTERGVDLILDVALQVRVELGSTQMTVEEVLGLSPGSVVELDRLAGEPVDIVVNDRLIARGEVVVVEENFGVRVTEIIAARARAAVG